jgi:hypothetical protein
MEGILGAALGAKRLERESSQNILGSVEKFAHSKKAEKIKQAGQELLSMGEITKDNFAEVVEKYDFSPEETKELLTTVASFKKTMDGMQPAVERVFSIGEGGEPISQTIKEGEPMPQGFGTEGMYGELLRAKTQKESDQLRAGTQEKILAEDRAKRAMPEAYINIKTGEYVKVRPDEQIPSGYVSEDVYKTMLTVNKTTERIGREMTEGEILTELLKTDTGQRTDARKLAEQAKAIYKFQKTGKWEDSSSSGGSPTFNDIIEEMAREGKWEE